MDDAEQEIRRLAREAEALRQKRQWFDMRNAAGKSADALALMAEESAMLDAEMMRVDRDLRMAKGRFAERR